jgi:soluble lytic murein transglycosylase-like protein
MSTFTKNRGFTLAGVLAAGAAIIGLLQIPAVPKITIQESTVSADTVNSTSIAQIVFGADAGSADAQSTISEEMAFVSSRDAYPASLGVVEQYADEIKSAAAEYGVPQDVAIGVALLENGGSVTAKSSAGALGIYQLMPATAKNLGLTVTSKQDDRKDPEKSIDAGVSYLAGNYDKLGDWGLATWAYHAGVGNVAKAVKIYASERGTTLAGISDFGELKQYIQSHNLTADMVLSDSGVQQFTKKLSDDSAGYAYKVAATATLFNQANA